MNKTQKRTKKQIIQIFTLSFLLLSTISLLMLPVNATYPTEINKGLIVYSQVLTESNIDFVSSHFDIVDMSFGTSYHQNVIDLHSHNSNIKVIGYKDSTLMNNGFSDWSTVLSNPTWFKHTDGGNLIAAEITEIGGVYNYLMDVSNTGWQQHYIDYVNSEIASGGYDGVFIDDFWYYPNYYEAQFNASIPSAYISNWHSTYQTFITHLTSEINGIIIINSDELDTDNYLNSLRSTDGQMIEAFSHASWEYDYDSTQYTNTLTAFDRKSATGKLIWCASGAIYTSDQYSNSVLSDSYNDFLQNSNDLQHSIFSFNNHMSGTFGYYSIMDTDLNVESTVTPTSTFIGSTSLWDYNEFNHSGKANFWNDTASYLEFDQQINDFTGYSAEWALNQLPISRGFAQTGHMLNTLAIGIYQGTELKATARVLFDSSSTFFGNDYRVKFGTNLVYGNGWVNGILGNGMQWKGLKIAISTNSTATTISYASVLDAKLLYNSSIGFDNSNYVNLEDNVQILYNQTFTNSINNQNITLKFFYAYSGSGNFDISLINQQYEFINVGSVYDPIFGQTGLIENWNNFLNMLGGVVVFLQNSVGVALRILGMLLPYFGTIIALWLLDALLTSIHEGEVTPIGNAFKKIWEIAMEIIDKIIAVGQAIAQAIPF